MRRGVIYARYSCDKQTDNSIKGQVRECTLFAERNDIQIINVYADEAISGRTDKRPAFLRMFRDAAQHQFDVIVIWKGDRFSRNRADAAKYKNELKRLNIQLLSATEANVTGPEAILMDGINEAFAEFYSVELAEKVNRGMYQNLLDGKHIGGPVLLGYKVENQRVVIDQETAPIVREAFKTYISSEISIRDLANRLNNLGYKVHGKDFRYASVQALLTNRRYIGEFKYKGEIHLNVYPAIIDKDIFDKAQEKLLEKKKIGGHYRTPEKYLLSGKLFCGECGEPMKAYAGISKNSQKLYRYYRCGGTSKKGCKKLKYSKVPLEKAVIATVVNFLTKDMNVDFVTEKVMKSYEKINPELSRIESALAETEQAIKSYKYALEKGLELDDTIDRLKELTANKKAYQAEIERLKRQEEIVSPETIKGYLRNLASRDYSQTENCNYLVNVLIFKVIIFEDNRIRIILNTSGEDPVKLEASVQVLMDSDHQFVTIMNSLHLEDFEFELCRIQRKDK